MSAETSDRVSRIAAGLLKVEPETLIALCSTRATSKVLAEHIRTLAASCLRQDQHRGLRGIWRKVTGK